VTAPRPQIGNTAGASAGKSLRVAIVGHTNTGKTSLIRTLLRDEGFGEIEDESGTTRSVEKVGVYAAGQEVLALYDTPGFEDSSALLLALEAFGETLSDVAPSEILHEFATQVDAHCEFDQECKILLQALNSDVLLYIIDVREPLLGKYRDEVSVLSKCAKPIIPVFNFIANNEEALARWRGQMAEFNLFAALEFDTVAFDFESEKRLYQKLQSVLEPHYEALQSLIDYRQEIWESLSRAAAQRIFELLKEVACYRRVVDAESGNSAQEMQHFVRKAEQSTLKDLLAIFSFSQVDVQLQQLPVQDGHWELDIFSPATLKAFGLNAGSSALTGATAGAGVDLMVGGLSLGTATVAGAVIGAGVATARRYKQELKAVWNRSKWLCVDDTTIALLYLRQSELLHRLARRGHAAQGNVSIDDSAGQSIPKDWTKIIAQLRQHPEWQGGRASGEAYERIKSSIVSWLMD
jgi:hypothetical protein